MSDKVIDPDLGKRDILESEIPRDVLEILLKDRTTGKNILWMTVSRLRLKLTLCFCVVLPDNGTMFSSLCCAPRGDGRQACHGERTGRIRFEAEKEVRTAQDLQRGQMMTYHQSDFAKLTK